VPSSTRSSFRFFSLSAFTQELLLVVTVAFNFSFGRFFRRGGSFVKSSISPPFPRPIASGNGPFLVEALDACKAQVRSHLSSPIPLGISPLSYQHTIPVMSSF